MLACSLEALYTPVSHCAVYNYYHQDEIMADLICDRCGAGIPQGARFCPQCADPVTAADQANMQVERGSERVQLVCPQCESQTIFELPGNGSGQLSCPRCSASFLARVVQIRSKRSTGSKKNGTRSFSVRVQDLTGREDLIEFTNSDYADFELKSKDLAAFSFINDQLAVVQNLTVGRFMKISKSACYVATYVYGPASEEVAVLRHWRDDSLLPSPLGAYLVRAYYKSSPRLVSLVGRSNILIVLTQWLLRPIVQHARRALHRRRGDRGNS